MISFKDFFVGFMSGFLLLPFNTMWWLACKNQVASGSSCFLGHMHHVVVGRLHSHPLPPLRRKLYPLFFKLALCPDFVLKLLVYAVESTHPKVNDFDRVICVEQPPAVDSRLQSEVPEIRGRIGIKHLAKMVDVVDEGD